MRSNQKLTKIIKGRTITGTKQDGEKLLINFDDGSTTSVKVAPSNANAATSSGKVAKVQQEGNNLSLELEGGSNLAIAMVEASGTVTLRNKDTKIEYLG